MTLTSKLRSERDLIYLRNRDVPGVIGKVGTILGESEINIADFSLGRRSAESVFGARARPSPSSTWTGPCPMMC